MKNYNPKEHSKELVKLWADFELCHKHPTYAMVLCEFFVPAMFNFDARLKEIEKKLKIKEE